MAWIRQETKEDYEIVYALVKQAFAQAEHCDGNEQDLVAALRKSRAFVPELSLVAERDGEIAGHILFTEAMVGFETVLALAPLSVLPASNDRGLELPWSWKGTGSPENWGTRIHWCWEVKRIIRVWAILQPIRSVWKSQTGCPRQIFWQLSCARTLQCSMEP